MMCGIAGIVGPLANEHMLALKAMLRAMHHRGPDGSGVYQSPGSSCLLGHTRLAIIDTSTRSDQPYISECKRFSLVYNGECYNFLDLKQVIEILLLSCCLLPSVGAMTLALLWEMGKNDRPYL